MKKTRQPCWWWAPGFPFPRGTPTLFGTTLAFCIYEKYLDPEIYGIKVIGSTKRVRQDFWQLRPKIIESNFCGSGIPLTKNNYVVRFCQQMYAEIFPVAADLVRAIPGPWRLDSPYFKHTCMAPEQPPMAIWPPENGHQQVHLLPVWHPSCLE